METSNSVKSSQQG